MTARRPTSSPTKLTYPNGPPLQYSTRPPPNTLVRPSTSPSRVIVESLRPTCENCARHASTNTHPPGVKCTECLPVGVTLKRCRQCKRPSYCSRECQRAHWPAHKPTCRSPDEGIEEVLGAVLSERSKTFVRWCKKNDPHIIRAGISAMELNKGRGKLDTHVFCVYLETEQYPPPPGAAQMPTFSRSIKKVVCELLAHVHAVYDRYLDSPTHTGFDVLERSLATRPGTMRVVVIDEGLPPPLGLYTMPTEVQSFVYDAGWLARLKDSITP